MFEWGELKAVVLSDEEDEQSEGEGSEQINGDEEVFLSGQQTPLIHSLAQRQIPLIMKRSSPPF